MDFITECKNAKKYSKWYIDKLFHKYQNIDIMNSGGDTALMASSLCSRTTSTEKMVSKLIKAGAKINLQNNDGFTALMYACTHSNNTSTEETVNILINNGANIDLQDNDGWTALMFASKHCSKQSTEETVNILINKGADPNKQSIHTDSNGWTALMLATNTILTENTINILLKSKTIDINIQNADGNTALLVAAINSMNIAIKILIQAGADTTIKNNQGKIFSNYISTFSTELIEWLFENGHISGQNGGAICKYYETRIEKIQYQIQPGTEFWTLVRDEYPNANKFEMFKMLN